MINDEQFTRILSRIKRSKRFDSGTGFVMLDESLVIDHYNQRYKITFQGQVLDCIAYEETRYNDLYDALRAKKQELTTNALKGL